MNLGYVVISYGNVTDTEPTALKEEFKAYTSREGKPLKAGPPGEALELAQEEERGQGISTPKSLCFSWHLFHGSSVVLASEGDPDL